MVQITQTLVFGWLSDVSNKFCITFQRRSLDVATVTLPTAFSNTHYHILICNNSTNNTYAYHTATTYTTSKSTTKFVLATGAFAGSVVCIGY